MTRSKTTFRIQVGTRYAEVSTYDSVGVEDCLDILNRAAMHRILTGEDLYEPIPREVKDFIIKLNLHI